MSDEKSAGSPGSEEPAPTGTVGQSADAPSEGGDDQPEEAAESVGQSTDAPAEG